LPDITVPEVAMPQRPRRRPITVILAVAGSVAIALGLSVAPAAADRPAAAGEAAGRSALSLPVHSTALVRLQLPDRAQVEALVRSGADVAGARALGGDRYQVDAVLSGAQVDALVARGARLVQIVERPGVGTDRYRASVRAATARTASALHPVERAKARTDAATGADAAPTVNVDTLHFLQAYWWTSKGQTFVGTEVATTATDDPDVQLTVTWTTADGTTGSYPLQRFVDDNEYQYHFALPQPIPAQPVSLTATSSLGGTTRTTPSAWPGAQPPTTPAGYQKDFISAYMTPEDVRARISRLARQYPDLVDVINLPNPTQGYRRTASGYLGDPASAAVVVETVKFGDQGWNGVQVKSVDPGAPNRPLNATYRDRVLTVSLATDASGAVISTVDQVAAFISAKFPQRFQAYVENGSGGKVMPVAGPTRLSDGLKATSGVPRRPWTVQALRIGVHRDGSRIGVLAYSQEHAREWATPLVTLEFAERLLANYATDPETQQLLDDVDVFVVPVTNPDGANYSFNDYNFQRKNMDDWCTGADRDPANRNRWGVDVNRNYDVGSVFDGYVGGSLNCLGETSAGTGELSEPESRNIIALANAHPNIKFAMNVHSYGGYFMWPPGAYKADGRITLPRPSIEESAQFLAAARQIVSAIAGERGTVTWPAQTGPVADVLYSAAGNSADELYYEDGIFAWDFEVGNDIWNPTTQEWDGVGFQPPYDEAHGEAMEYASGLVALVRVADQYQQDHS
jgi:hypothetical protein